MSKKQTQNNLEDSKQADQKLSNQLLDILVCPLTKTPLTYDKTNNELISKAAKLAYPVHNGMPVMLPSEARPLKQANEE